MLSRLSDLVHFWGDFSRCWAMSATVGRCQPIRGDVGHFAALSANSERFRVLFAFGRFCFDVDPALGDFDRCRVLLADPWASPHDSGRARPILARCRPISCMCCHVRRAKLSNRSRFVADRLLLALYCWPPAGDRLQSIVCGSPPPTGQLLGTAQRCWPSIAPVQLPARGAY